jgi:hypothetical protein
MYCPPGSQVSNDACGQVLDEDACVSGVDAHALGHLGCKL